MIDSKQSKLLFDSSLPAGAIAKAFCVLKDTIAPTNAPSDSDIEGFMHEIEDTAVFRPAVQEIWDAVFSRGSVLALSNLEYEEHNAMAAIIACCFQLKANLFVIL